MFGRPRLKMATFISYLSCLKFKLLYWLLESCGHIQSKNRDAKSKVSIFFKSKSAIGVTPAIWQLQRQNV